MPWWGWVIVLVAGFVIFVRSAIKSHRRELRRQVITFLKLKDPSLEIVREAEDRLVFKAKGVDEGTMYLHNLYAAIAALKPDTPDARLEVCEKFYAAFQEHRASFAPLELAKVGERVKPRLVPPAFFKAIPDAAQTPATPMGTTGLSVVYVLDGQDSVMFLTDTHAKELGLDTAGLHTLALQNLAKTFPKELVHDSLNEKVVRAVRVMDTFDAARVLLVPGYLSENQQVAAAIPDRDTLLLAPVPGDGNWSALKEFARSPGDPDRALLARPLKISRAGFELV